MDESPCSGDEGGASVGLGDVGSDVAEWALAAPSNFETLLLDSLSAGASVEAGATDSCAPLVAADGAAPVAVSRICGPLVGVPSEATPESSACLGASCLPAGVTNGGTISFSSRELEIVFDGGADSTANTEFNSRPLVVVSMTGLAVVLLASDWPPVPSVTRDSAADSIGLLVSPAS